MLCDFKTFHSEVDLLKTILTKYNYRLKFIDSSIKLFLNPFVSIAPFLYSLKTSENLVWPLRNIADNMQTQKSFVSWVTVQAFSAQSPV